MAVVGYKNKQDRVEPNEYVNQEGSYRFKIVKHEVDGYTNEGNEKNKFSFEANKIVKGADGKPALSADVYSMNGIYTADEKQEWVFMALADALKIDVAFDPSSLIGYYFMGEIKSRMYNDKKYFDINPRSYKYSNANNDLPPVPAATVEVVQEAYVEPQKQMPVENAVAELDPDEEVPF